MWSPCPSRLQAVLRKVLHAAAVSAEAAAPQLQPATCEALVEATCNNIASMALTPALTGQLRREMLTLEAAATAACRHGSHIRNSAIVNCILLTGARS
jgi:hypothetical protein